MHQTLDVRNVYRTGIAATISKHFYTNDMNICVWQRKGSNYQDDTRAQVAPVSPTFDVEIKVKVKRPFIV